MTGKKRHVYLTKEDKLLWKKVTDSVKPLNSAPIDIAKEFKELFENSNLQKNNSLNMSKASSLEKKKNRPSILPSKNITKNKENNNYSSDPINFMGRQEKSRLARGIKKIEARLDLHGMTQKQAYDALLRFLEKAQSNNLKNVLVITGKGSNTSFETENDFLSYREAPGVLRRKLPDWLYTGKMKRLVTHFDEAAPNHGGSGAFYISIRKRK